MERNNEFVKNLSLEQSTLKAIDDIIGDMDYINEIGDNADCNDSDEKLQ